MLSIKDVLLRHVPVSLGGYRRRQVLGVDIGCAYGCECGSNWVGSCYDEVGRLSSSLSDLLDTLWGMSLIEGDDFEHFEVDIVEKIYGRGSE